MSITFLIDILKSLIKEDCSFIIYLLFCQVMKQVSESLIFINCVRFISHVP